jgi:hypothetical protein
MYAEIIEKLHAPQEVPLGCASNMKFFTYPSELRFLRVCHLYISEHKDKPTDPQREATPQWRTEKG